MDPVVALATVRDRTVHLADRLAALNALSGWVQMGGFVPAGIDALSVIQLDVALGTLTERLGPTHNLTLVAANALLNTL